MSNPPRQDDIVCRCMGVTRQQLEEEMELHQAYSFHDIREVTGICSKCCHCFPNIEEVIRSHPKNREIICYCMEVTRDEMLDAIRQGATEVTDIMQKTHAGTGCGRCRIQLRKILAEQSREA